MPDRIEPYFTYNFSVELDGITRAGFRECSGLTNSQQAITYREGTDRNLGPRKAPGLLTHGDVTLGRGITTDRKLWDWREKAMRGRTERHDISISLVNDVGEATVTWNLYQAWPTSWTGPSLNALGEEFAIEQITITYERIEVDAWS